EMSSWAVMSMMGLYSVDPASTAYELCSPVFPKIVIRLNAPYTGGRFVITTTSSPALTPYIQSVKLDGRAQKADWIKFKEVTRGGRLSFTLGKTANRNWGAAPKEEPPSLGPH
ncbi:MAG: glycoside hydrolase domain-containing protein, partial [Phycisphaerae bacterium]